MIAVVRFFATSHLTVVLVLALQFKLVDSKFKNIC